MSRPPAQVPSILIRIMVGGIFLSEGVQKFLFPETLGGGRFAEIGIVFPHLLAPIVAVVEIVCGVLVLTGLLTRIACVALIGLICCAIVSTKLPILLGHGVLGFELRDLPRYGLAATLHEARTDLCMLLGSLFLLISGPGRLSLDAAAAGISRLRRTPAIKPLDRNPTATEPVPPAPPSGKEP